ncbi:hypothetical protein AB6E77_01675 [Vibrio sp. 10N.247.311.18]|uniref:hypothetical protein n=1 Tax=unclassified Vibrio TaxID=2614977 RepID=UPI00354D49D7
MSIKKQIAPQAVITNEAHKANTVLRSAFPKVEQFIAYAESRWVSFNGLVIDTFLNEASNPETIETHAHHFGHELFSFEDDITLKELVLNEA